MALKFTYTRNAAFEQWIAVKNVVHASSGLGVVLTDDDAYTADGTAYQIFFTNWNIPPFIPDWSDPDEVARAEKAGRYFRTAGEARVFQTSIEDSPRTFFS